MTGVHRLTTACLAIWLGAIGAARQQPASAVTPGELVVEPPTLINLGFEWLIDGDSNRNAVVEVSYRKVGPSTSLRASDGAWNIGMPLLRLQHEKVTQPNVFNLVSPNMFVGSQNGITMTIWIVGATRRVGVVNQEALSAVIPEPRPAFRLRSTWPRG